MLELTAFVEISLVIILAVVISAIMHILKQPPIIGYILTGMLAGPAILNFATSTESFEAFSQIGVALLLFMVGLHLNPKIIKDLGKVALLVGLGQIGLTIVAVFGFLVLFGFSHIESLFMGIAFSFSSTIIAMKFLADRNDMQSLYGQFSIGILIVQDIVAMIAILFIGAETGSGSISTIFMELALESIGLLLILFVFAKYILPKIANFFARVQEYLLFFATGWCLVVALLFQFVGFSLEIGALLAGTTLSISPFRQEISARMKILRDFFILLFFVMLGTHITPSEITLNLWPILIVSVSIMVLKPIIIMILLGLEGYTKRTGFLVGITLSQASEFTLIFLTAGVALGRISDDILIFATLVAVVTFTGSSYLSAFQHKIYNFFSDYLTLFERKGAKIENQFRKKTKTNYQVVLFGCNRTGKALLETLHKMKRKILVIDYNPDTILELQKRKIDALFGDAEDQHLLSELNFKQTKLVISTVPDLDTSKTLIRYVLSQNPNAIILCLAAHGEDALELYEEGATYVIMPHFLGGKHTSLIVEEFGFSQKHFLHHKLEHLEHLHKNKKSE